jgi:hypothetical protein
MPSDAVATIELLDLPHQSWIMFLQATIELLDLPHQKLDYVLANSNGHHHFLVSFIDRHIICVISRDGVTVLPCKVNPCFLAVSKGTKFFL